ncbi:MAG: type I-C CRISPR-associated protein Cas8c/Csd1 [Pirellulaceae bacterium]
MILQKLCDYYDRLAADPDVAISEEGFAPQKVSFEVVIEEDGSLHAIQDIRDTSGKKPVPRSMQLPYCGKRAAGIMPMFLWDKADYLLGWVPPEIATAPDDEFASDQKKRLKKFERIGECHDACKTLHLEMAANLSASEYDALKNFFDKWTPTQLSDEQDKLLREIGSGFGVFRIRGQQQRLHELPAIRNAWAKKSTSVEDSKEVASMCLVSGEHATLARLHPPIKGVSGAQSSGASIVSFNLTAFTSYGKTQSYNAPVSESAAFRYTTALNMLLQRDLGRKVQIGDTACVFWADKPTESEDLFGFGLDTERTEDETLAAETGRMLKRIALGEADVPEAETGFYVLGLAPNASRLSVRFWITGTAGELIRRVAQHQQRLEIVKGSKDRDVIPLWLILAQTSRETKEIPPLLGGALLRAVLTGGRYPDALLAAILRRIRADREIKHVRAATIKAILNHNHQLEIPVMLDSERQETSYQLGRLFASLERAQEDALPGLNATIKDRYFGAASATPATVFPRLIRMSQHHLGKLEGGKKVVADKRMQEIMGHIDQFPSHMNLTDQGLFAIGYYHQRQDFFTKKPKGDD